MKTSFNKRLQHLIDIKKINQSDLAEGVSVTQSRVSHWLRGTTKNPQRATLRKIADFFGCNIDWLADGTGNPFPQTSQQKNIEQERVTDQATQGETSLLAEPKDEEQNITIPEALDMTKVVLESKTEYRNALMSNIKAFYKAVLDEDEMRGIKEEMQDIKKMLAILLERTGVEPEQKREAQTG